MPNTKLQPTDILPLTCTRTGTCCHGNQVFLNSWELACLAREAKLSPADFRMQHTNSGGIVLRFNGKEDKRGKPACSLYTENEGCSVHLGRPLACRLFPLGRQVQSGSAEYIFQGTSFPCLNGCAEVVDLPQLSVSNYLMGQQTAPFEQAQDTYLEIMQNLAENAFALLLDTGLAATGETETLAQWRKMGEENASSLAEKIGAEWLDALMLPTLDERDGASVFADCHNEQLQNRAQEKFGAPQTNQEFHEASVLMMGLALYLARALGANPKILSEHWIEEAKSHGACE